MTTWMTAEEAAAYARVGVSTLRKAAESGELSGTKLNPNKPKSPWRFTDEDIDRWLERGRIGALTHLPVRQRRRAS